MSADDPGDQLTYYVRVRGKIHGPFDLEKLRKMQARGQFSRAHEVSADRRAWQSAATLESLFSRNLAPRTQPGDNIFLASEPWDEQPGLVVAGPPESAKWYYNIGDERHGPVSLMNLRQLILNRQLTSNDLIWKDGMADWAPVGTLSELHVGESAGASATPHPHPQTPANYIFCYACGNTIDGRAEICPRCGVRQAKREHESKSRVTAAILALCLGGFGAHHFYLGNTLLGIFYLLFCWTFIPAIISFIEGIVYLTMSDKRFAARYDERT